MRFIFNKLSKWSLGLTLQCKKKVSFSFSTVFCINNTSYAESIFLYHLLMWASFVCVSLQGISFLGFSVSLARTSIVSLSYSYCSHAAFWEVFISERIREVTPPLSVKNRYWTIKNLMLYNITNISILSARCRPLMHSNMFGYDK